MIIRRSLIAFIVLLITLGAGGALAQRPDHGGGRVPLPDRAATPHAAIDCAYVEPYMDDLDEVLSGDSPFVEFMLSDVDFEDVSASQAEEIIEDGDDVIASMNELDVPAPYQPGHDGIVLFMQTIIDYTRFYALDTSSVPDIVAYDNAMTGIYQGEVAIAEACPDEVEDIGGFVFIDPATLEDEYGDEQTD